MKKMIFSVGAVMTMINDCYKTGKTLETGGILIGPGHHKNIITHSIPSTAYAEKESATYYQSEDDVEILNHKLREFQASGYDFKGYYHQHPAGMNQLSQGDIDTSIGILKSPDYKIDNNLVMIIITETPDLSDIPIFVYSVSLNKKGVVVESLPYKIMPERCIEEYFIDFYEPEKEEVNNESNDNEHCAEGTENNEADEESEELNTLRS